MTIVNHLLNATDTQGTLYLPPATKGSPEFRSDAILYFVEHPRSLPRNLPTRHLSRSIDFSGPSRERGQIRSRFYRGTVCRSMSQYVHSTSTVCPQYVHSMCTVCPQYVHSMFRVCCGQYE
ncbi:uncharacterized protein LOC143148496 [Ptiloglossa arizonensis]|uniref:uncharacterized protein LOC143148496 n=1 Tax=Ptiloglossa arizonensis TaxID=3350558 RepID=UPI003FA0FD8D